MDKEEATSLLETIEEFNKRYQSLKIELPYSFNLLDEVKTNENAHSKVLKRLLEYKEGDEYPFLKSFVESVDFNALSSKIKNPIFFAEKDRIDISIKDDDYAIIIENKIHHAREQKKQIDRYVEKVGRRNFKNKIFVLYLTRTGGDPTVKSLSKKIKGELGDKYKAINYRDNILPWLEKKVLPQCRIKHEILVAGIKQYMHHLKGLFKTREEMNEMNEELLKHLHDSLQIKDNQDLKKRFGKIEIFEKKINTLNLYINKMKGEIRDESNKKFKEYKDIWSEKINKQYPENVISCDNDKKGYWWIGINMKYNDKRFLCGIGYDNIKEQNPEEITPYYGITCRPESNAQDADVKDFVIKEFKIEGYKSTTNWYIQKRTDFNNVFEEFKKLLNEIQQYAKVEAIKQ